MKQEMLECWKKEMTVLGLQINISSAALKFF